MVAGNNGGGSRVEGDSWDITSGVGATAADVAAARAAETARPDALIHDPFAAILLDGREVTDVLAKSSEGAATASARGVVQRQMVDYHAARTHYFDAFFTSAAAAGIRQVVILASGLDSRAFRLSWPPQTTVFEVDQPKVLQYKADRLAAVDASPTAIWRPVAADLRDDWPTALRDNGFDPRLPTAWSAEGLLPFLTGRAQDTLFTQVASISGPNSRIAVECYRADGSLLAWIDRVGQRMSAEANDTTVDDDGPADIWYGDSDRTEPTEWFDQHGWSTRSVSAADYLTQLSRPLSPTEDSFAVFANFVAAEKK